MLGQFLISFHLTLILHSSQANDRKASGRCFRQHGFPLVATNGYNNLRLASAFVRSLLLPIQATARNLKVAGHHFVVVGLLDLGSSRNKIVSYSNNLSFLFSWIARSRCRFDLNSDE